MEQLKSNPTYQQLIELCKIPSISETNGEQKMAERLYQALMKINYFQIHQDQAGMISMKDDPYGRSFVYGLMEGETKSPKTVVLLSHFDVVGIAEYGMMKTLAFDPEAYTQYLQKHPEIQLSAEAREDLISQDYLFGRGTMDMKFGIAADFEMLLRAEAQLERFEGNLLFISVPDEESNSAGMLAATEFLLQLQQERNLSYRACIVSEPHFPQYAGDQTNYLYTGTIGKLLPVFYCAGKEAHVCEPFSGLNPNLLTGKIVAEIEANPDLADRSQSTTAPAPVCLKQADTKDAYSVQTPTAAYAYFNYMTLSQSPRDVMKLMLEIGEKAFREVLKEREARAKRLKEISGDSLQLPAFQPRVIPFQELLQWCEGVHGDRFVKHMESFVKREAVKGIEDMRSRSIEIVKEVHQFCPYRDPMIIVFYAPPYYPHASMEPEDSLVGKVSQRLVELAMERYQESLRIEPFFPGLSDMSYLGLSIPVNPEELTGNFPLWEKGYSLPLKTMAQLNIPFINLGPRGKDAHQYTERLCLSYSFEKAIPLIWEAVNLFLE